MWSKEKRGVGTRNHQAPPGNLGMMRLNGKAWRKGLRGEGREKVR